MNWIDILAIVLVVGLGALGWWNGVIRWAFTLIGGIVGVVLAGRLYTSLAPVIPLDNEGVQQVVAFAIIFLAVLVGAWIGARLVKTTLSMLMLGWVDHTAGAVLGVVVGVLITTALVAVMGIVPADALQDAVEDSVIAGRLTDNVGLALALLPEEFSRVREIIGAGTDG